MSNIKDVASLANVGTSTVSRVLNNSGNVSIKNREKVLLAIEELGYIPNAIGRSLKAQKSNLVALFVPTIKHVFFSKVAFHIEDELYKKGYKTVIVSSQGKMEKELETLEMAKSGQVDGIIFMTDHQYSLNLLEGINVVTYDRHNENVTCVTSDNYESSYNAIKHLINKGCKKIAYIGGKNKVISEVTRRHDAYIDIMKEYDYEIIECYVDSLHGEELDISKEFLENNQEIDGIFAQSDVFANCCYQILTQMSNKRVPQDVKIISFDGIMDEILQHPKFTVIKQDIQKISESIVDELTKKIDGKKASDLVIVPTEFVLGETTEEDML